MGRSATDARVKAAQGRPAGIVSRVIADLLDLLAVLAIAWVVALAVSAITIVFGGGIALTLPPQPLRGPAMLVLLVAYLTYGWGLNGRTLGKLVMGLRLVRTDGSDVSFVRALIRAVIYALVPILLAWAIVSRRNASVPDLVVDTAVVYDWGIDVEPVAVRARRRPQPVGGVPLEGTASEPEGGPPGVGGGPAAPGGGASLSERRR